MLNRSGVSNPAIAVFMEHGLRSVYHLLHYWSDRTDRKDKPRSGCKPIYSDTVRSEIIAFYCQSSPLPEKGRWTLRWAGEYLEAHLDRMGVAPGKSTIHRILNSHHLKPHRSLYFLHITDPDFFPKMEHLLQLYNRPPDNLISFDECPGIQILKRITPDLRTEAMRIRLEEFEYIRNGTMDVFAFLDHRDSTVYAECQGDHKAVTFLQVFRRHVARFPETEQVHYVMDNLSTHTGYPFCQVVAELSGIECPSERDLRIPAHRVNWLTSPDKRIVIHYTPYHGSWLNRVEIWFGIMGQKVLKESFGSPEELIAAFESFVSQWNQFLARPFRWKYKGDDLHGKAVKRFTGMLRGSAESMEISFLTKSLELIMNLHKDCYSEVPVDLWSEFDKVFWSTYPVLVDKIIREPGPKRFKKASDALEALSELLIRHFDQIYPIAA